MTDKLDALLREVYAARAENLALQSVCAILLGEIAILNKFPRDKLGQMTAGLQGAAAGLAAIAAEHNVNEPTITETIERVSTMAETALEDRSGRG